MNGFELNKILAAVLMTVLIVFGVGKFTDFLFRVDVPSKPAYVVEAVDNVAKTASISGDSNMSIQELLAMGDLEHGKKVFKKCSACHMIASGGKNMIGPNLWGIIGRDAASIQGYSYSKALIAMGGKWGFEEMNGFLIKPSAYVKGTKMAFAGLIKEKDRASVILYMNSKSDSPLQKP